MSQCETVKIVGVTNQLGEGVIWDYRQQCAWWTDILACELYRFEFGQGVVKYQTPEPLCAIGLTADPAILIGAFASGFHLFKPITQTRSAIAKVEESLNNNRLNDGRVDRNGRFWAGSMRTQGKGKLGALYQLHACTPINRKSEIEISNSLCWSPDGRYIYHADTPKKVILRACFNNDTGQIGQWHEWVGDQYPGYPDGACVDSDGCLWSARWGANCVLRFCPNGELLETITLPCEQPTCVAFGGADLNHLFVTSATDGLGKRDKKGNDGNLFIIKTAAVGLKESICSLPVSGL